MTNHVSPQLVKQAFAASKELFALPEAHKLDKFCRLNSSTNMGYSPFAGEQLNSRRAPDLKEAFNVKKMGTDFSSTPGSFKPAATELFAALERFFKRYCLATTLALGLDDHEFFVRAFGDMELCTLRFLHYPPCDSASTRIGSPDGTPASAIRVGEHTDFGMNTILHLDSGARGLQVKPVAGAEVGGLAGGEDGEWLDVDAPDMPGAVVNTGALLARWTNDVWCATAHRVVVPDASVAASSRYSIACFMDPDRDAKIAVHPHFVSPGEKPRYGETTGGEYLTMKLRAAHDRAPEA